MSQIFRSAEVVTTAEERDDSAGIDEGEESVLLTFHDKPPSGSDGGLEASAAELGASESSALYDEGPGTQGSGTGRFSELLQHRKRYQTTTSPRRTTTKASAISAAAKFFSHKMQHSPSSLASAQTSGAEAPL